LASSGQERQIMNNKMHHIPLLVVLARFEIDSREEHQWAPPVFHETLQGINHHHLHPLTLQPDQLVVSLCLAYLLDPVLITRKTRSKVDQISRPHLLCNVVQAQRRNASHLLFVSPCQSLEAKILNWKHLKSVTHLHPFLSMQFKRRYRMKRILPKSHRVTIQPEALPRLLLMHHLDKAPPKQIKDHTLVAREL
jgi:hypothetical protein